MQVIWLSITPTVFLCHLGFCRLQHLRDNIGFQGWRFDFARVSAFWWLSGSRLHKDECTGLFIMDLLCREAAVWRNYDSCIGLAVLNWPEMLCCLTDVCANTMGFNV
jgi:hypothetical protein